MLYVSTCLWNANSKSEPFSQCYTEEWVEKLYRGFYRNLTVPFRFVCFVDRLREFKEPILQEKLRSPYPDYGCFIEPFRMNLPMILVGLDTLIVRNIDHMAHYCLNESRLALPRNPYQKDQSINGVALIPSGHRGIYDGWNGENDMEWLRRFPNRWIDDLWPGQVLSLKFHDVRRKGLQDASIVYMHGRPKQHQLMNYDWLKEHWR